MAGWSWKSPGFFRRVRLFPFGGGRLRHWLQDVVEPVGRARNAFEMREAQAVVVIELRDFVVAGIDEDQFDRIFGSLCAGDRVAQE